MLKIHLAGEILKREKKIQRFLIKFLQGKFQFSFPPMKSYKLRVFKLRTIVFKARKLHRPLFIISAKKKQRKN